MAPKKGCYGVSMVSPREKTQFRAKERPASDIMIIVVVGEGGFEARLAGRSTNRVNRAVGKAHGQHRITDKS